MNQESSGNGTFDYKYRLNDNRKLLPGIFDFSSPDTSHSSVPTILHKQSGDRLQLGAASFDSLSVTNSYCRIVQRSADEEAFRARRTFSTYDLFVEAFLKQSWE